MVGSQTQTVIGRPIVPDAAVHAVVEEHVSVIHCLSVCVYILSVCVRMHYSRT